MGISLAGRTGRTKRKTTREIGKKDIISVIYPRLNLGSQNRITPTVNKAMGLEVEVMRDLVGRSD